VRLLPSLSTILYLGYPAKTIRQPSLSDEVSIRCGPWRDSLEDMRVAKEAGDWPDEYCPERAKNIEE
jgi:hypothetical protein